MQHQGATFSRLGLKLNVEKTEMMRLVEDNQEPQSNKVGPAQPKNVCEFRYLGSSMSNDWSLDKEVTYRIG